MSTTAPAKSMDDIVALCKRRGFIYPASEIYGGLNGFWDFGPLGVLLKNNLRDAWWREMVLSPPVGPDNEPLSIVGVDSAIIQNPKVWEASGHVAGFNDPKTDCRSCKGRFRADHLVSIELAVEGSDLRVMISGMGAADEIVAANAKKIEKLRKAKGDLREQAPRTFDHLSPAERAKVPCPNCGETGTLTEPRQFNLMLQTYIGAVQDPDSVAYLRPETAQGVFINYKNVLDTSRVKVPFGIAQVGKAFRNEVNPRNFIFRSREFEQMEMEWFCAPDQAAEWFAFWQERRMSWWCSLGLAGDNLRIRKHDPEELAHYAKGGAGTVDIEYRFPFTWPDFTELEGIAHRTDFDLAAHQKHSGVKLEYFDQERNARYMPHVIEPASGLTRGVLAVICEAYTPDPQRPSGVSMRFHPRLAPIQAAFFPLVAKDGMPEVAEKLYHDLRGRYACQIDVKQSIGKRYARMDEAGTPFCFTIDGQTMTDQTVTVRDRDTAGQERIGLARVAGWLAERIG